MKLRVQFTFLIVVCVLIFFTNRSDTIPDIMEARNLVTAREMVVHGNWLLPTLNGEPRLAKPPLPTWLTAITAIIAGDTGDISSLRIPGALIASLMVFALFIFTREISQNPLLPFLSAVVLATSFLIINMGRSNSWDIFTNSFMLLAIAFMLKGMKRKNSAYGIWCLVGLFWGLTLMSKGPVSFYGLLLPFLIGYIIFFGYHTLLSRWREILLAILITLLISLPWPLYVWYHIPQNLWFTLNHESTQWLERHVEPFWFYWGFTTQTGIWTAFAIITLVQPYISKKLEEKREYKMILAWLLLTIFLLSVIPEKKERYLIPCLIPLSIMVGYYFNYLIEVFGKGRQKTDDQLLLKINMVLLSIASLLLPIGIYWWREIHHEATISQIILPLLTTIGFIIALWFSYFRKRILHIFLSIALFMCLTNVLAHFMLYNPIKNQAYKDFGSVRQLDTVQKLDFYSIGPMNPKFIWSIGREVKVWDPSFAPDLHRLLPLALFTWLTPEQLKTHKIFSHLNIQLVEEFRPSRKTPDTKYFLYLMQPVK